MLLSRLPESFNGIEYQPQAIHCFDGLQLIVCLVPEMPLGSVHRIFLQNRSRSRGCVFSSGYSSGLAQSRLRPTALCQPASS